MTPFHSPLATLIRRYITLKQSLGRRFAGESAVLCSLDRHLAQTGMADLSTDTFAAWSRTQSHLQPGVRRRRFEVIRNFCLYRRRTDPSCYVPDGRLFPARHQPVRPHIFSDADVFRLLGAVTQLPRTAGSPLRPDVFRVALVLLYTTGIRLGELSRLLIGDYDAREGTFLIRESKFHKSRYVPLSPDGVEEMARYLRVRHAHRQPIGPDSPLLWNRYSGGRPYTGTSVGSGFRQLFRMTRTYKADGRCPRVHDFRHTFAIRSLLRWYDAGDDLHAKLPLLATYMGHVDIASTAYYLPFVEPLGAAASARFAQCCGDLISTAPKPAGGVS